MFCLLQRIQGAIVFEISLPNWPKTATSEATDNFSPASGKDHSATQKKKTTPEDTETSTLQPIVLKIEISTI